MDVFAFIQLVEEIVLLKEDRKYWTHSNHKILKQLVLQIIAGCDTDSTANLLRHDLVSQSSISRNLKRVSITHGMKKKLIITRFLIKPARGRTLDASVVVQRAKSANYFLDIPFLKNE